MRFASQFGCRPHHPQIFSRTIPDGDAGITQTIRWMKALVAGPGGVRSPEVRQAALEAARGTERGMQEIDAVLDWIKQHIEFRGEYGETLQEPRWTLMYGAGDCDCQTMLADAMLRSLGYMTRYRTVAMRSDPQPLTHVYLEVQEKQTGQWLSVDPTVARAWAGWQPEGVARSYSYGTMRPKAESGVLSGLLKTGAALGALALFL